MFHNKEYIYEVYKERSFSRAAANLYISQPSLSAMVKKAETAIGSPIFDRSTNPVKLTDVGREYVKSVEKIMDIEYDFGNYLNDLNELKTGTLAVGASNFFASYILPPIITEFKKKYPQVKIHLVEADTANLERQLFAGMLDLIIDNYQFNEEIYEKYFYCSEHLLLAVPGKLLTSGQRECGLVYDDIVSGRHRNADTPSVSPDYFAGMPFILLRLGNDTRVRADKICAAAGFRPEVILELDQMATSYHLTAHGMGITFVSDTLVNRIHNDPEVVYFKLDSPYAKRDNFFYYKQNKYMTRAMKEFLDAVTI